MKIVRLLILALFLTLFLTPDAIASPSREVFIPSTDSMDFLKIRGDLITYFRSSPDKKAVQGPLASSGDRDPGIILLGGSVGVLPFDTVRGEIGIEYTGSGADVAESSPVTFNVKVSIPQEAICRYFPGLAVGMYNIGSNTGETNQDIAYGLISYQFLLGKFTAGGYRGEKGALGGDGSIKYGVLAAWHRTLVEFSNRLWVGADYMGGKNINSSVNFGVAWAISKNASVMGGYNLHTDRNFSGTDTIMIRASYLLPW